jgi:thiamine biosynthesis lipoprotein ApbE
MAVLIKSWVWIYWLTLSSSPVFATTYLSKKQALKLAFGSDASYEKVLQVIPQDLKKTAQKLTKFSLPKNFSFYKSIPVEGQAPRFAIIDNVIGKHRPITYLLALGADLKVRFVEIMAYRESRGGQVRSKTWRHQFVGKASGDRLRVGRSIDNIVGATLSCRALAKDISKNLILAQLISQQVSAPVTKSSTAMEARKLPLTRSHFLMDTIFEIKIAKVDAGRAEKYFGEVFSQTKRIEEKFSSYLPQSETILIWQGVILKPSEEYSYLTKIAEQARQETEGLFDVNHSDQPDFGGIVKGYALDRAVELLKKHKIKNAMFNFGGQIYAVGASSLKTDYWEVKLDVGKDSMKKLKLKNQSISASNLSERGMHIVSPESGQKVTSKRLVYIIDPSATKADYLSTAFMAANELQLKKLMSAQKSSYLIISENGTVYSKFN